MVSLFISFQSVSAQELWTATSTGTNCPSAREYQTAVWIPVPINKMIIWGGSNLTSLNTGGVYDPSTDTWTAISTGVNCPTVRYSHTAVLTGNNRMIIWGGSNGGGLLLNNGAIYDPSTDTWTPMDTINAPVGRIGHTAVWTGSKMIVWGGLDHLSNYLNTGGVYDPITNTWTATSTTNVPSPRWYHTAVWTGSKMIVWGGDSVGFKFNTGGSYDPTIDSWTSTSTGTNCPSGRYMQTAVWTGNRMIVWGGAPTNWNKCTGGIYNPSTNTWIATDTGSNCPHYRYRHIAVWTGDTVRGKMIVWSGRSTYYFQDGGIFDPVTNSWTAITLLNVPSARNLHTAVWTGSKMIVWGGIDSLTFGYLNTGGVYTNDSLVGVNKKENIIPGTFTLFQNYPNPFNPVTIIKFDIPTPLNPPSRGRDETFRKGGTGELVKLVVYDILGREIATLVNEQLKPGSYEVEWDGTNYASGLYFYRLHAGDPSTGSGQSFVEVKKMVLLK
jgi:N-acetylneuraminic acid mutarotase